MARKERIKNTETWQQIREEVIYVLQKNDLASKEELVEYFRNNYAHYNLGLDEFEVIVGESKYINELLKKNKLTKELLLKRLEIRFDEILKEQLVLCKQLEKDEQDEKVLEALYALFDVALTNDQLHVLMLHSPKTYEEIAEELK